MVRTYGQLLLGVGSQFHRVVGAADSHCQDLVEDGDLWSLLSMRATEGPRR